VGAWDLGKEKVENDENHDTFLDIPGGESGFADLFIPRIPASSLLGYTRFMFPRFSSRFVWGLLDGPADAVHRIGKPPCIPLV